VRWCASLCVSTRGRNLFPNVLLKPLGHLSASLGINNLWLLFVPEIAIAITYGRNRSAVEFCREAPDGAKRGSGANVSV
jgi:hypothetical protein